MRTVLFLGNSLTYYNNLPLMVQTLAEEAGIRTYCEKYVRGGAFLHEYAENMTCPGAGIRCIGAAFRSIYRTQLPSQRWNTVVIQEQTYNPAGNKQDFLDSIDTLVKEVFVNGEEIFFYQTWPYKPGCVRYDEDPKVTLGYEEMYVALKEAYAEAAERFHGTLVPVGDAFYRSTSQYPEIELYNKDSLHPSPMGTYLAACIFAAKLYGLDPEQAADIEGLDPEQTAKMRSIAKDILCD